MSKIVPNDNLTYLFYWCCERMNIFWKRYNGEQYPWTDDEILQQYKFTNVYRVLDRSSQYMLRTVIYNGKQYSPEDMFFRILLYKHFNLPDTWDALIKEFGDITYDTGWENIARFLDDRGRQDITIYSNAFMLTGWFYSLPEYANIRGTSKHRGYFEVFKRRIFDNGKIDAFLNAASFEELFGMFKGLEPFSDFMSQQYCLDLNYSPLYNFTENDFVAVGPGSKRGIQFAFKGDHRDDSEVVIRWTQEHFEELMTKFCQDSGMIWNPLPWESVPTLTNIQNCFCELSKYAKCMGVQFKKNTKGRMKNLYTTPKSEIPYMFPRKWNVKMPLKGQIETYK